MAFEKKKKDADGKDIDESTAVEDYNGVEEIESAEIVSAAMEPDIVLTPVEDPHRMVKITPRLLNLPAGSSMTFSIGGKLWSITDNKTCLVSLDVARQLEEKGLIPPRSIKESKKR